MAELLEDAVWRCELPVPNWKFVLVALLYESDEHGFSSASIERVKELTGFTELTVVNAIEGLKSRRIILERTIGGVDGLQINQVICQAAPVKTSLLAP